MLCHQPDCVPKITIHDYPCTEHITISNTAEIYLYIMKNKRETGLEPATYSLEESYSNQLNYSRNNETKKRAK